MDIEPTKEVDYEAEMIKEQERQAQKRNILFAVKLHLFVLILILIVVILIAEHLNVFHFLEESNRSRYRY